MRLIGFLLVIVSSCEGLTQLQRFNCPLTSKVDKAKSFCHFVTKNAEDWRFVEAPRLSSRLDGPPSPGDKSNDTCDCLTVLTRFI